MKLFRTSSIEIVEQCQEYFDFEITRVLWLKHVNKIENKLKKTMKISFVTIFFVIYFSDADKALKPQGQDQGLGMDLQGQCQGLGQCI